MGKNLWFSGTTLIKMPAWQTTNGKVTNYLKANGVMAEKEWIFDKGYNSWFYLKSGGTYAAREWIGSYYLKSGGYMAKSEWIDDSYYNARYYLDENGVYVTGTSQNRRKSTAVPKVMENGLVKFQ